MKFPERLLTAALAAFLICMGCAPSSQAETWPTRPITLVIPFGAGGTVDTIGRTFANIASKELGQPVIVENRPGGGGIVGAISVARAAPDGYTITLQAIGPLILRPLMDSSVKINSLRDFSPIGLIGDTPNVILGGTQFATLRDVADWAKKNPGRLTIGHPGPGTMGHLAAVLFASRAGITATYIAYRSVTEMLPDLLSGRINIGVFAYGPQAKTARILAVMTADPVGFLPGVPSIREAGFPGVYASTWFALFGPPKMPPDVVAKINSALNVYLRSDEGRKRLEFLGLRPLGGSPEQLLKQMAGDTTVWGKVIRDGNIKMGEKK